MYRSILAIMAIIVGGIVFFSMFPSIKGGMSINTVGWLPVFQVMGRYLPFALFILFFIWILATLRGRGNQQ